MDALDEFEAQGTGIVGSKLDCTKGHYHIDGIEIDPESLVVAVIIDSAIVGEILFVDKEVVEQKTGRLMAGFVPPKAITKGWTPSTQFLCVGMDERHKGELFTFRSVSYGGLGALRDLVTVFNRKKRTHFPVCELETKKRGDEYGTIDPVFRTIGWVPRGDFPDLVDDAPVLPAPTAPRALAAPPPMAEGLPERIDADDEFVDF